MVRVPSHLRSVVSHDGAVILDIPHNTMTTLDPIGAYVWARLERGVTIDVIVRQLAQDTGADESVVARDVAEFMEQLMSRHLVRISERNVF